MAVPATQGKQCKYLEEMEIGDYIRCTYTATKANVAGEFSDLGGFVDSYETQQQQVDGEGNPALETVTKQYGELPTTPGSTANGYFYFLKVDKSLLVADRMVQTDISAQALNSKNYLQGSANGRILFRSLSQKEWMEYVVNNSLKGTIVASDNRVWYYGSISGVSYKGISTNRGGYIITNNSVAVIAELNANIKNSNVITQFSPKYPMSFNGKTTMNCGPTDQLYSNRGCAVFSILVTSNKYAPVTSGNVHTIRASFRPAMEYVENPNSKTIYF